MQVPASTHMGVQPATYAAVIFVVLPSGSLTVAVTWLDSLSEGDELRVPAHVDVPATQMVPVMRSLSS